MSDATDPITRLNAALEGRYERLLAMRTTTFDQVSEDVLVQNFFEELRRVVPDP